MKKMRLLCAAAGILMMAFALALTGCGGGGSAASSPTAPSAASTGRATISLLWPTRTAATRLIPSLTNSARVTFSLNGTPVFTTLLVRPSAPGSVAPTTTTAADLPSGNLTVDAVAYPNTDGTGTPLAQTSSVPVTITAGASTPVRLTLATAIARVDILPQNVTLTAAPADLNAVAYDAQNNVVLTTAWTWTNTNPAVVELIANGSAATVRALSPGTSTVTATETESGKSAQKIFNVLPGG